jgi:cytochrome oxidase Cu insertion factor (SCO1/SenC/PrrC family)
MNKKRDSGTPGPSKPFHGIFIAFAIAALLVVAYFAGRHYFAPHGGEAPALASRGSVEIGGPFSLIDQDGKPVTDADFRGRYMLVYFGYTYCPDVCPTSLNRNIQALDLLDPAEASKIQPILISVDPARDTPAHLKEYVGYFSPRLVGLAGNDEQVAAAAKAYGVYYAKVDNPDDPEHYLVDHTSITYLIGPDGRFVQHFRHDLAPDEMAAQLRKILG